MKRLRLQTRLMKATPTGLTLSATLLIGTVLGQSCLFVYPPQANSAQTTSAGDPYDSFSQPVPNSGETNLPPEIVPIDPNSAYSQPVGSAISPSASAESQAFVPGLDMHPVQAVGSGQRQSAKDFRREMMNSLAGQGNYPQFNNQNPYANQLGQAPQAVPPVQSFNPQPDSQQGNQSFDNNSNQSMNQSNVGQSNWTTSDQTNPANIAAQPQTQSLTGGAVASPANAASGSSYGHGLGLATSLGSSVFSGALMRGSGGLYGLGMLGGTLLNYGAHSGFRF